MKDTWRVSWFQDLGIMMVHEVDGKIRRRALLVPEKGWEVLVADFDDAKEWTDNPKTTKQGTGTLEELLELVTR